MTRNRIAKELLKISKLISASKEYVIWGTPPGKNEDTLLMARHKDEIITDKNLAKKLAKLLEDEYGCTKTRIQELDLSKEFNWNKSIGLKKASRDSVLEAILPVESVADMQDTLDEQTWNLAVEVYQKLEEILTLTQNQKEALNRLRMSATTHKSWPQDQHRNNIFKAAHSLGIQLPSMSF